MTSTQPISCSNSRLPATIVRQSGQAMTEFVIGAVLFLLPLFLILPMLGKYADIKATAAQTARYVAWERTVWFGGNSASVSWPGASKSETDITNEARKRVTEFGQLIKSTDKSATDFNEAGGRAHWKNRDGSPMLKKYSDIAVSPIANQTSPDLVTGTILGAITTVTAITGFNLETKGLYTGQATITVDTLPIGLNLDGGTDGRFAPGTLAFTDKNVIMANGWSANGSGHVKTQTAGLAPLGLLGTAGLDKILQAGTCAAFVLFAPELCFLELGKIEPDIVPPDRLTP